MMFKYGKCPGLFRIIPEADVNGWYFGNIIFGGLLGILIVDSATGVMWKIHQDSIAVNLYPGTPEGRNELEKEELMRKAEEKERDEQKVRMGLRVDS